MNDNVVKLAVENADDATEDTLAPAFSEEALALEFARRHAHDLRFIASFGKWMYWNGHRWSVDHTRFAWDFARLICREASNRATRRAASIAAAKTRAAVISLAGDDRRLAATTDQWDADPWLINTPAGILDLRSGEMAPHRPDAYMTRITSVAPYGECPRWQKFLDRVTDGDEFLKSFLQRVCGYLLTGATNEHALFFLHGLGANGKSVFLSTISGILGDYHRTAPIETFTAAVTDRHPTELAMLRGARLVSAIETEEGRAWAESKIKALTGGDRIAARFMRQDFFEYVPQFKLVIAGNHRPALRSVDEAIRRRMHLIPFAITIPAAERDPELLEKLKPEHPGILAWMVAGCIEWQRVGLNSPESVTSATQDYLESEDAILAWLEDCCRKDVDEWISIHALFTSFKTWAETSGERAGTKKQFSQRLEAHGFQKVRRDARGFAGLTIYMAANGDGGRKRRIWEPPM